MRKQLLFLLATLFSLNSYSQVSFEKGYYIDNADKITKCFIKNKDWRGNPTEIEYKLSENSEAKKITIKSMKEFGIDNGSKYIKSTVDMDRSIDDFKKLSYDKDPVFNKEELLLKVLIEGKSNLYEYVEGNLRRFFYTNQDSNIEQLVFNYYQTDRSNKYYQTDRSKKFEIDKGLIAENHKFREQLWENLNYPNLSIKELNKLDYTKKDLMRYFTAYNESHGGELITFESNQKKDLFNLNIRPRINRSYLFAENIIKSSLNADFNQEIGFGFGLEAEFIISDNKNRWAIIVEPTFQTYKSETISSVNEITGNHSIAKVTYNSIETPIGIRHYFRLNQDSKIFVNASVILDLSLGSSLIAFTRVDGSNLGRDLAVTTGINSAFGAGYKYNDKYSLELRYQTSRDILEEYLNWSTNFTTLSVILGYSFF